MNLRFYHTTAECEIPHSSGSLSLLRDAVKAEFDRLEKISTNDLYFEYTQGKLKKKIDSEFHFNIIVNNTKPNDQNERILDLKVQIKGQKAYEEWKMSEVAKLYNDAFKSSETMAKFSIDDLPESSPPLTSGDLESFINQLEQKLFAFQAVTTNEATAREFISIFMTWATSHVRKNNDNTTRLAVEVDLDGTRGYGSVDYGNFIQYLLTLVTEAKMSEMEKGVAQNLIQLYSAAEVMSSFYL